MKKERKRLTKKQITAIVIIAIAAAAVIATAVTVPVVLLGNKGELNLRFVEFDRLSDLIVTAVWDGYNGAKTYTVEYMFGGDETNKNVSVTSDEQIPIYRQAGILSLRVKPNVKNGKFSDWVRLDIPEMELSAPKVAFNADGILRWNFVKYSAPNGSFNDENYLFDFGYDGNYATIGYESWSTNEFSAFPNYMLRVANMLTADGTEWRDIVFCARVKAVLPNDIAGNPFETEDNYSQEEKFLQYAYKQSEYGTAEFILTEEIYNNLKRMYNV